MEAGLLIVAVCIVALTTLTLANETHWARSASRNDRCFTRLTPHQNASCSAAEHWTRLGMRNS